MKILLAPSESKAKGGIFAPPSFSFDIPREHIIRKYDSFLQITDDVKNFGDEKTPIFSRPTLPAIKRYTGVAFKHLEYESLDKKSKDWLNENLIIFSNLFGILKPLDLIPHYTLKQGAKPGFDIYNEYRRLITPLLNEINEKEVFIDLRAKFYEKMYKPKKSITFKFLKNKKVVSHFAKAYRGELTRMIAIHKPTNLDELLKIPFNVKIIEVIEKKGLIEIVCEV